MNNASQERYNYLWPKDIWPPTMLQVLSSRTGQGQVPWRTMAFHIETAYKRKGWETHHRRSRNTSTETATRCLTQQRSRYTRGKTPLSCPTFLVLPYWSQPLLYIHSPLRVDYPLPQHRSAPLSSRRLPCLLSTKIRAWILCLINSSTPKPE